MKGSLVIMARSSWLDNEKTNRKYKTANGLVWEIQNEYRKVRCPDCNIDQYCRLTHIWRYDNKKQYPPEYHINFNTDLQALKGLLVTYISNEIGVREVEKDGQWVLMAGDKVIGES